MKIKEIFPGDTPKEQRRLAGFMVFITLLWALELVLTKNFNRSMVSGASFLYVGWLCAMTTMTVYIIANIIKVLTRS